MIPGMRIRAHGMCGMHGKHGTHTTALVAVDDKLEPYEERIESLADAWLVIQIGDPEWVFDWRSQAEDATRKVN